MFPQGTRDPLRLSKSLMSLYLWRGCNHNVTALEKELHGHSFLQGKKGLDPLILFSPLKFNKWGMKTGFIGINNAKFIQIENQEEKNNAEIQNLKL
jgi:hypothetical protein